MGKPLSVRAFSGLHLKKQGFKVSQIMKIINKSKNWVMKWYVHGETEEFNQRKKSGRPSKLSSKVIEEPKMSKYKRDLSVRKKAGN